MFGTPPDESLGLGGAAAARGEDPNDFASRKPPVLDRTV
jgi:hypothetical protein